MKFFSFVFLLLIAQGTFASLDVTGFNDDQIFPNAGESCPDANDVIDFAKKLVN